MVIDMSAVHEAVREFISYEPVDHYYEKRGDIDEYRVRPQRYGVLYLSVDFDDMYVVSEGTLIEITISDMTNRVSIQLYVMEEGGSYGLKSTVSFKVSDAFYDNGVLTFVTFIDRVKCVVRIGVW